MQPSPEWPRSTPLPGAEKVSKPAFITRDKIETPASDKFVSMGSWLSYPAIEDVPLYDTKGYFDPNPPLTDIPP